MKRLLTAAAASLLLILALVGPVGAADQGPGCSDFGAASGGVRFGKLVSSVKDGVVLPGFNSVSQLVQAEHEGLIFTWPCAKYAP